MTKAQLAMLKILADTKIKNETIAICVMGGPTVTLTDIDIDEEAGILCGENVTSWPDLKHANTTPGPAQPAKTFTVRIEMITGFWA